MSSKDLNSKSKSCTALLPSNVIFWEAIFAVFLFKGLSVSPNFLPIPVKNTARFKIRPLAGLVGAPLCEKYKKDAVNVNYKAIKDCVSLSKNKKIIFLMSNSGYGVGEKNKFCTEDSPLNPISLYGKTKCDAEKEVIKAKNYVCFRLATVLDLATE